MSRQPPAFKSAAVTSKPQVWRGLVTGVTGVTGVTAKTGCCSHSERKARKWDALAALRPVLGSSIILAPPLLQPDTADRLPAGVPLDDLGTDLALQAVEVEVPARGDGDEGGILITLQVLRVVQEADPQAVSSASSSRIRERMSDSRPAG